MPAKYLVYCVYSANEYGHEPTRGYRVFHGVLLKNKVEKQKVIQAEPDPPFHYTAHKHYYYVFKNIVHNSVGIFVV